MKHRLANLDLLRGVAALLVCTSHLRAFLLVNFGRVADPGILDRGFYLVTGLGHQAVVAFFVLSGYLVGGSVFAAYESGRWSWLNYASRRLSRLWMVLLPALLLTLILDNLGRHWNHAGYEGAFRTLYNSGPSPGAPSDLRATTFLGNACFLQTICVGSFGTNNPLWSLANEFWYYAMFPLLCGVAFIRSMAGRLVYALLFAFLVWWLPSSLVWSGLIWLLGVGAFWAARSQRVRRVCGHPAWLLITGVLALGSLAASKTTSVLGTDWGIGVAFALWVVGLVSCEHHIGWLKTLGCGLSELSYTLYVMHFPMLAIVFFCFFEGKQFQPGTLGYTWFAVLLAASVTAAGLLWWCFERNTDRLRKRIEPMFFRRNVPVVVA